MKIVEKCPCGAQIEAEHVDPKLVQRVVDRWRRRHNHQYSYRPAYQPYTWTSGATGAGGTGTAAVKYMTGSWESTRSTQQDRSPSTSSDTATRRKTGENNGS